MGLKKTISDISIIARIYYLQFRDQLGKYLFSGLLIPLASFLMASATAGSEPPQQLRFFTGALLLSGLYSYRRPLLRQAQAVYHGAGIAGILCVGGTLLC